ncbi:MAG: single-stranded DNA-binding protein [Alphaproteobacteria bacterium]|nr:single-stranded DNA-binding protein [Alphaproteobacteria bacterium]
MAAMIAPVMISAAGRLARDPKRRTTASGKDMALATIAVDLAAGRDADPETWWLSLVAFGRVAGELAKHRKGDRLAVMGQLQRSRYRPRDGGEERDSWTVICDAVLGPRSPRPSGGKAGGNRSGERSGGRDDGYRLPARPPPSEGPIPDDEIPF